MKEHLKHLTELTSSKSSNDIKSYLENLHQNEKGKVFESYLSYLFEGNGYMTKIMGGKGDLGADILLYNPKTPQQVDLIVQAKNWSSPLPFDDVKSELIKFEDRGRKKYNCTFYQLISINGYVKDVHKLSEFNISLHDWKYVDKLISNYDDSNKSNALIDLRPHNQLSFDKTIEGFKINNRICVIQATGTGKSYVTARLIQEHIDKKTLLVAPSNLILKQFEENFHYILANTDIVTYAKLANIMKKESREYDIIILDEFHRCGADIWGTGVETLLDKNANSLVFGTSATPIRTLDKSRDMSDEIFDRYVANEITLPDAIVRSILPNPKYVSALYNIDEDVESTIDLIMVSKKRSKEKTELVEEIKNAKIDWEKTSGIPEIFKRHIPIDDKPKKFIVFCQNKNHLADMELDVQKWILKAFGREWDRKAFTIISEIDKRINERTIDEFKSANSSKTIYLMFSIDMFNEGLHLPDVDGVILLRPTQSDRIFLQQIGRCLQVGSTSAHPLIFDLVNNFMSLRSFNFRERLDNSSRKYNKRREQLGLDPRTVDVEIIDESKNIVELFDKIVGEVLPWNIQFGYLKDYIDGYNTWPDYETIYPELNRLGIWYFNQRNNFHRNKLTKDRIEKLESIGIDWRDLKDQWWEENFLFLKEFIRINKRFPKNNEEYPEGNNLVSWCSTQRLTFKENKLSLERKKKLDSIGFKWNPDQDYWYQNYNYLLEFIKLNDRFPKQSENYPDNNHLGSWCSNQKTLKNKNKLTKDQLNKLNIIGFIWNVLDNKWEQQYQYLKEYIDSKNKNPLKSTEYPKGNRLGSWCHIQKQSYRDDKLSNEKYQKLDNIGFIWDKYAARWDIQYSLLIDYLNTHNQYPISHSKNEKENKLARWVNAQRTKYKKKKLSINHIDKLNEINFTWDRNLYLWDSNYNYLLEFIKKNKRFPKQTEKYPEGNTLGIWFTNQKKNRKKNRLSNSQIQKLDTIGYIWDVKAHLLDLKWKGKFHLLEEFIELNNRFPFENEEYPKGNKLGTWCYIQRKNFQLQKLSEFRINALQSIGFSFDNQLERQWKDNFNHLKQFIKINNRQPKQKEQYPDGNKLGLWYGVQKLNYSKGKMSQKRINLLKSINFLFSKIKDNV